MRRAVAFLLILILSHTAAASCPAPRLTPLRDAAYYVAGAAGSPTRANCGRVANTGVLIGPRGALIFDPGPSALEGAALLGALRAVTPLPVRLIVNSHAHPENVLANGAVAGEVSVILASARTGALMRERCPACVRRFAESIGDAAMSGTRIVLPDRRVDAGVEVRELGRPVKVLVFEHAHTPGDVAVFDPGEGVLFAGGLIYSGEVPDMREASLSGWISALRALSALKVSVVVPGHGPAGGAEIIGAALSYLEALEGAVRRELESGGDLASSLERIALPEFAHLGMYSERHVLNIQHAWREIEPGYFAR